MEQKPTETPKPAGVRSVYLFEDLDDAAKEKARNWYREQDSGDTYMLQSHLINLLGERLEEAGFKVNQYGKKDLDCNYSLSYSQGDGFSFTGTLERGGKEYKAERTGTYYVHEMTMCVYEVKEGGEEVLDKKVTVECRKICKEMEQKGYGELEYMDSAEYIDHELEANEYTFTNKGERLDADH